MSANPNIDLGSAGGGDVTPRIGNIEPLVMRCEYQLPWDRKSNQTACGQTIQNVNGDMNWRVVIEGLLTRPQLSRLRMLRGQSHVDVVTEEFGGIRVAFDELNITRRSEEGDGEIDGVTGPIMEFQLQTKEDDEGEGVEFFNENTRGNQFE